MAKLKQQTKHSRVFLPKHGIKIKGIDMSNFHMHYGLTELGGTPFSLVYEDMTIVPFELEILSLRISLQGDILDEDT